jgi:hypothetical protein
MKNTIEYIMSQSEYFEDEYWKLYGRVEEKKKEYEQAKATYEMFKNDLERIDQERHKFAEMHDEIIKLAEEQKPE